MQVPSNVECKTNSDGKILLKDIVVKNDISDIDVKLKEIDLCGKPYKKVGDEITFKLKYNVNNGVTLQSEPSNSDLYVETNSFNVNMSMVNYPIIDIGGKVWIDKQENEKDVKSYNGIFNESNEFGLDGVIVHLFNVETDEEVAEPIVTHDGGQYKFEEILKAEYGYYITFEYNGIKYQEVNGFADLVNTQSKATEQQRNVFNNRFKTISKNQSNDGTTLSYDYKNNKSVLNGEVNGTNPVDGEKNFKIIANSDTIKYSII